MALRGEVGGQPAQQPTIHAKPLRRRGGRRASEDKASPTAIYLAARNYMITWSTDGRTRTDAEGVSEVEVARDLSATRGHLRFEIATSWEDSLPTASVRVLQLMCQVAYGRTISMTRPHSLTRRPTRILKVQGNMQEVRIRN